MSEEEFDNNFVILPMTSIQRMSLWKPLGILMTAKQTKLLGRSSVWLERVIWDHEAAGSSPVAPTT